MAIFIEGNKKIKNIFANVNGEQKSITSAWVNKDDIPTKVFQLGSSEIETDPYEVAPTDTYLNYNYTLDDDNNIITLNYYTGSETDVIVYANYVVNGHTYKTRIAEIDPNSTIRHYPFTSKTIKTIIFSNSLDTSNMTTMEGMFSGCKNLTSVKQSFDTSNVISMKNMFYSCEHLVDFDFSNFNTSKVMNMSYMFVGCTYLSELDLRSFDTSNVSTMYRMFYNDYNLKTIYVTNGKWSTSIAETTEMFKNCGTSSVTFK